MDDDDPSDLPGGLVCRGTERGLACPVEVTLDCDQAKGVGTLKWKANPAGRRLAKYRVYSNDEKGFTIGDQRYQSTIGVSKEKMGDWNPRLPASFIAETTATERVGVATQGLAINVQ